MSKKTILIISLLFLCVFIFANFAFADNRELETAYPEILGVEAPDNETSLPGFIKYIFNFIISIGGILAFGILIYSAIHLFLSSGNPQEISEAKSQIMSAVMGLAILFGSYTILTIINPDLRILRISELNPFEETEPDPLEYTDLETKYYKEIPVGFLTENLLAKNINCFDNDNNLVNCYTREVILEADEIEYKINNFNPDNPEEPHPDFNTDFDGCGEYANFCYDYDIDGIDGNDPTGDMVDKNDDGMVDLLTDHDRLDCIKKLSQAIQIKSQTIKDDSYAIKTETARCNCAGCNRGRCSCDYNYCHCCGSARNISPKSCFGSRWTIGNDPCSSRGTIDALRNNIYQIAYGDTKKINLSVRFDQDNLIFSENSATFLTDNIDNEGNSKSNPLFLDLREAKARMIGFKQELEIDLDYLENAEKLTVENSEQNSPYRERISLAEYEQKKSDEKIDKIELKYKDVEDKNFNISEYCRNFHCAKFDIENPKICVKYGLNDSGKLCETYNLDGDGATLYFPSSP